jgi:hypothetical protein
MSSPQSHAAIELYYESAGAGSSHFCVFVAHLADIWLRRCGVKVIAMVLLACVTVMAHAAQSPAQRVQAFAKLPDWSGIWEVDDGTSFQKTGAPATDEDLRKSFAAMRPPFNAEWESKYQKARESIAADRPCTTSLPLSVLMAGPGALELIVTPEETAIVHTQRAVRHIYTDGRTHPPLEDLWPTAMGDSIGHWEGSTLVVHTIATTPEIVVPEVLSSGGFKAVWIALSSQVRFVERLTRTGTEQLEDKITMVDATALARPWQQTLRFKRVIDFDRMIEDDCENERNPVVNGKFTVKER